MAKALIILVLVLVSPVTLNATGENRGSSMCNENVNVLRAEATELQKFARWFHQDHSLIFDDFRSGAEIYLESLRADRRMLLRSQLENFLVQHERATTAAMRKAWLALGAEAWDRELDVKSMLTLFLDIM